jgi:hypothetical protein
MSSFTESLKFAQPLYEAKSADMLEKQEVLIPLIKNVFPDWTGNFINKPIADSIEVMMRQGIHFIIVRFRNEDFLKPSQQRDDYFLSLLFEAKSKHESNPVVKVPS